MAFKQFNKEVKIVRSDNGTEFTCLATYFRENGILHQTSCVATHKQNGRVERKHCHILNVSHALLFQSSLPVKFWGEAVLTASHLINRTPSKVLNGRSPYELLYGESPSYSHLKVFGCLCYVHLKLRDKNKFSPRSARCIFVGYPFGQKGCKEYDLEKKEFFISRDVIFHENKFPMAVISVIASPTLRSMPQDSSFSDEDWMISNTPDEVVPVPTTVDRGSLNDSLVPQVQKFPETELHSQVQETEKDTFVPIEVTSTETPTST